ncbi:hypothetical protein [Psychroflexus planctonicus]|uniref:Uncharacterized protein n=1 Tax=Psychroflexus planctonicus TaxID=1526575 RepID=A0ABQ1SEC8_9FLAO|nr:hypothetical protein [Psychroflexus planctonicus]GGE30667.1 hypothetical protein GCM10010832_08890 [Psychroflexus planctonicus]
MKLSFTYLLIILFSLQSFGVNAMNLVNFSNLISHYNHHKVEHQDSFWEFIDLHYGSQKQAHSDEHDEHQELPFQEGFSIAANVYYISTEQFNFTPIQSIIFKQENFNYEDHFSFLHATEILQPPKHLIDYKS